MKYALAVCLRRRSFRVVAVAISVVALVGVVCSAAPIDPKPIGDLIDIGGRKLHIHCTGSGTPTVLIENGGAAFSFDWELVQPQVANFTRICTYDRAGYAWSDPGPEFDTLDQAAHDLHVLLRNAGIGGPYVLVGHSLGGMLIRFYESKYPADVVGMVLVDSSHEESLQHVGAKIARIPDLTPKQFQRLIDEGKTSHRSNPESDPVPATIFPPYDKLPAELQNLHLWALKKVLPLVKTWGLNLQSDLSRLHQLRVANSHPLGDIPLAVLTASQFDVTQDAGRTVDDARQDHLRLQNDLAQLSANTMHVMVSGSGHEIYLYKPDVVVHSIADVIFSAKNHSRLQSRAAAPDSAPFVGTWEGRTNSLPGLSLRMRGAENEISGDIVFYFQKRDDPSGRWQVAGEAFAPLLEPRVEGKTLTFEVQHHRCDGCAELGPNVKFRMALVGTNEASLWNLNELPQPSHRLILVRQPEASGSPDPTLRKGVSVEMVGTNNASPMPEADQADAWIVTVTENGSLYFGVDPVTPENLAVAMKSRFRNREQELYIKADARAPFAAVKRVLEAARADLFQTAVLLTSQPSPSKQGRIVAPQGLEVMVRQSSPGSEAPVLRLTHSGRQWPLLNLNNKETSVTDLRSTLEQTLQNRSDKAVLVKAEGELSFTQVVQAIDVCRSAGAGVVLAPAE